MPHLLPLSPDSGLAACPIPSRAERLETAIEILRSARGRLLRRICDSGIGHARDRSTLYRIEELIGACRAALLLVDRPD